MECRTPVEGVEQCCEYGCEGENISMIIVFMSNLLFENCLETGMYIPSGFVRFYRIAKSFVQRSDCQNKIEL